MGGAKRKASEPAAKPAKKPAAEPAEAHDAAPSSSSDATVLPLQINPKRVQKLRDGGDRQGAHHILVCACSRQCEQSISYVVVISEAGNLAS